MKKVDRQKKNKPNGSSALNGEAEKAGKFLSAEALLEGSAAQEVGADVLPQAR